MRLLLALLLTLVLSACVTQESTSTWEVNRLKRQLDACNKRMSALEQRQKLVEEELDEALSRWNLLQDAIKNLQKFQKQQISVKLRSKMGKEYTKAYIAWYSSDYAQAARLLSAFIAKYNDPYLTQQAQLLLADSYYHLGEHKQACQILKSFIQNYKDSVFLCGAYYKAAMLKCRVPKPAGCKLPRRWR